MERRSAVIVALVAIGLGASSMAGAVLIEAPAENLPGVALGSATILVVERIAVLFAAWLIGVVVLARALSGQLPTEITSQGFRYADLETSQVELSISHSALARMDRELHALSDAVAELRDAQGRYAMGDDGHGH